MWTEIFLIVWAILAVSFKCSLVIDRSDQNGIHIKDYCPKMKYCAEGSHTMCMYYNPSRIAGPRCSNFKNVTVDSNVAEQILGLVNEMRGRIAMGKETGSGNVTFPRGYGMFQLKWDTQLATFAQVLANTCTLRHDLCRATKQFSDPGQLASIVRFSIQDWMPVQHMDQFKQKGLIPEKVEYAASEAYKSWYQHKQYVTLDMIENLPDWMARPSRTEGKNFLQLIDGQATHMGCGVSAYVEYAYKGIALSDLIFNTIHIVCNFSSQPKKGRPVYRMNGTTADELCPPGDRVCKRRYNSKCGCPPGTDEDDRCLCTDPITYPETPSCGKDKNCKPAVVLLPIFTVEDAPQSMIARQGLSDGNEENPEELSYNRYSSKEQEHDEVVAFHRRNAHTQDERQDAPKNSPKCHHKQQSTSYIMNSIEPPYTKKRVIDLRNHYSEEVHSENEAHLPLVQQIRQKHANRILPQRRNPTKTAKKNRASVFSRAPKFDLHNIAQTKAAVKMDVAPRKDFSKAKQALSEYLNEKKKHSQQPVTDAAQHSDPDEVIDEHHTEPSTTKPTITIRPRFQNSGLRPKYISIGHSNNTKHLSKLPKSNKHLKNRFRYLGFNIDDEAANQVDDNNAIEETDKKLMSLLDSLEQEVKHADLDGTEKDIFDAKLKKIYGSVKKKSKILVSKEERHDLKENIDPDFVEEGQSEIVQEKHTVTKEKTYAGLHNNVPKKLKANRYPEHEEEIPKKIKATRHLENEEEISKKIKATRHPENEEEIHPDYKQRPKYGSDFDEPVFSDSTDDPNKTEFDKQMYDTEDMITDLRSKDGDNSLQSLYSRPLPRKQKTLRPIVEKMDYVFRNTLNDAHDVKIKKSKKNYRGTKRFKNLDHSRVRESNNRIKDEVKVLPYHLQYKNNRKRDKYRILNKYNAMKNKHRNLRPDDEKSINLNRIDEKIARYDGEVMSDDGDDIPINYNSENGKRFEEDYERDRDYPEDPLSAERMRFYQDKLDNLVKSKYSTNNENSHGVGRGRRPTYGRHILGIRKNRSNLSRFYVPNRASRHNS